MAQVRHLAVILDGNRRYAKKNNLAPFEGHKHGLKKVRELLVWSLQAHIKELTLFAFSTENFKRATTEVEYLFDLFRAYIQDKENFDFIKKNDLQVHFIGKLSLLPTDIQTLMHDMMEKTENHHGMRLNYAMAYGSRTEIVECFKTLMRKVDQKELQISEIDEEIILSHLWLPSEPDLVIRTSGEFRLSNFLLYQSAYAEWFITAKLFPELCHDDFLEALKSFENRERRYGR